MPETMTPTNLIARAQRVMERAKQYVDLRCLADQQNHFRGWHEKFQKPATQLNAINCIRQKLSEEGVPLRSTLESNATRRDFEAFLQGFRTDRNLLITPNQVSRINDLLNRIKAHVTDRQEKTREDWRAYVKSLKPPIPSEVLDVLERVPAFCSVVHDIRSALTDLERAAERLPPAHEEILRVREQAKQVRDQWKDLGGEGIPEEVLTFLRAAGPTGAPLHMLTEAVKAWLQANNLESSFAVKMRTTPQA